MIQTLLWRLDSIPIKTKFILRIRIRHLIEPIIPPELSAFPHILYRGNSFLLHALRNLRDLCPHSEDVLSSYQCELLLGRSAVQDSFQEKGEARAVLKARDDGCNTYSDIRGTAARGTRSMSLTIKVRSETDVLPPDTIGDVEQMIQKHVHRGFGSPGCKMLGHKSNHNYAIIARHKIKDRVWHITRAVKDATGITVRKHNWCIRALKSLFCGLWRNVREINHHA
jgi:hypothetical protein